MSDNNSPFNQTQPQYSGPISGESYQQPGQQIQPLNQYGQQQQAPMQGQRPQHPLTNYQFSSDEMRILRECNNESFFQRSVPFSTVLGLGTHFAVKNGVLGANPKYGSIPKVVVSVIVGYFLGKVSYQQKCAEKMMQLPNSKLGEILRQKKQGLAGTFAANQGLGTPGFGLAPFSSAASKEDVYDDTHKSSAAKSSALDLDTERPSYELDDNQSFSDSSNQNDLLPLEPPKKTVTYEELRTSNRDNYYKRMQSNVPDVQDAPTVVRVKDNQHLSQPTRSEDNQNEPMRPMKKNQYGDAWSQ